VRFTLPIQVASTDIDELAHVSNQVYLRWVLEVATGHSTHLGWDTAKYLELGAAFVVRRHELDYLAPVKLGDELRAETWVPAWRAASCTRMTEVLRGDQLVLRAQTTWAFMDLASQRPIRIPEQLRALFNFAA
jgi:acyl-CoA thioester hydrolase